MSSIGALGSTSITIQSEFDVSIIAAAQDAQSAISAASAQLSNCLTSLPTYRKENPFDAPSSC